MDTPAPALRTDPITTCRACASNAVVSLGYARRYYLSNLDQVVEVPYAACTACGLVFQATYPGDVFLSYYYERSPMLRRSEVTPYEVDQHERQSAFLARHVPLSGKKVLEIGAGSGGFLRHLHDDLGCDTYFDDLSAEARATMSGIPGLKELSEHDAGFDIVVLRHVLEHVNDVDAFLARVAGLVHEDGVVFVEVPDWTTFDTYCDPLIFEHLSQFTSRGLLQLFDRLGWGCLALEKSICATDPASPNRVVRGLFDTHGAKRDRPADVRERFHEQYLRLQRGLNGKINAVVRENPGKSIALYPASHLSYSALLETDLSQARVIGMFDIDVKKHGKVFNGIRIYEPSALTEMRPDIILITTMAYEDEIRASLRNLASESSIVSLTELMQGT